MSLDAITAVSSDPSATAAVFAALHSRSLPLASDRGALALRETIAANYAPTSNLTAEQVLVANGTTGANHILHRSLLSPGDHVIIQYPSYGPLIEEPRDIGCDISYWKLDANMGWNSDLDQLRQLIRPGQTKLIILDNPNNPTGTHRDNLLQRELITIAREHNIPIHCDEIFHPLFHHNATTSSSVSSMNDHADLEYDKIITTSSLSKAYGLSGIRVGWIATRDRDLYERFLRYRLFSTSCCSQLDELVATEVLSPRCRPGILQKHLRIARDNIAAVDAFVHKYSKQIDWVRPTAGGTGFVRFKDAKTGSPRDDVRFCERLVNEQGVLVAPGSRCFEISAGGDGEGVENDFKGRVRIHITAMPDVVHKGLEAIGEFLEAEQRPS